MKFHSITLCLIFSCIIFSTSLHSQDWTQVGAPIVGEASRDLAGRLSLSTNGKVVAIGAYFNSGSYLRAGHVRIFEWNESSWIQLGEDIDGEAEEDWSGLSVSLNSDGNVVAISAENNDGNGEDAGHVRVFEWNGSAWIQRGEDIDGEAAGDYFGTSVSMNSDGNVVAIGACQNDGNGEQAGHVRIFDWDENAWNQRGDDIDGEAAGDYSGISNSISSDGNIVAIGAHANDGNGDLAGHVRVFEWDGLSWIQRGADIDGEAAEDKSGWSVCLESEGRILAVSACNNDGNGTNSGHVRVYEWDGFTWSQRGNDIDGEAAEDKSGSSVSLNSNGNVIAIGAERNDGNGEVSGHVRVFDWFGTKWIQRGTDIDGEYDAGQSGNSVDIDSIGDIVAIGSPTYPRGTLHGHVRMFTLSPIVDINDTAFLNALIDEGVDVDLDGLISFAEAGSVSKLDISDRGITDLTGIQTFVNLDTLYCRNNDLTVLDIRKNTALILLDCEGNKLQILDLTQNRNLKKLDVSGMLTLMQVCVWELPFPVEGVALNIEGSIYIDFSLECGEVILPKLIISTDSLYQPDYIEATSSEDGVIYLVPKFTDKELTNIREISIDSVLAVANTPAQIALSSIIRDATFWLISRDSRGNISEPVEFDIFGLDLDILDSWIQLGDDIDGEYAEDFSGVGVSISADGSIVAIGATYNDETADDAGHARVYKWNGDAWTQRGEDINGEGWRDLSGSGISLSADGNIVAIGATHNRVNGDFSGHVRIYHWSEGSWNQRGADIDGEKSSLLGEEISLNSDGSIIAIGASGSGYDGISAGLVRVYQWNGSNWIQIGDDIDGEGARDDFGSSLSLSSDGSVLAIGARFNDGIGFAAGHTRIYKWNGSTWIQLGVDLDGKAAEDSFGSAVSLSSDGNIVAIGAFQSDTNRENPGYVQIYNWDGSAWNQIGRDIKGENAGDFSGSSISINADGTIVAVGARFNDGYAADAGHVRVFHWDGGAWLQLGLDIDGESAGDFSGFCVRLNSDGNTVAIGAPRNDEIGSAAGHTRIYRIRQLFSIPDTAFLHALIDEGVDTNQDSLISIEEAGRAHSLDISGRGITDLTGIEAFVNLDTLNCSENDISELDFSMNTALRYLACSDNSLNTLNVSNNALLQTLNCENNLLSNLDISNNTELLVLECNANQLVKLDIRENNKLVSLDISDMPTLSCILVWESYPAGVEVNSTASPNVFVTTGYCPGAGFENNSSNGISVYPNPSFDVLTIEIELPDHFTIEITSLNGQLLRRLEMEELSRKIDISSFQKGVYFITIKSKGSVITKKIIKL